MRVLLVLPPIQMINIIIHPPLDNVRKTESHTHKCTCGIKLNSHMYHKLSSHGNCWDKWMKWCLLLEYNSKSRGRRIKRQSLVDHLSNLSYTVRHIDPPQHTRTLYLSIIDHLEYLNVSEIYYNLPKANKQRMNHFHITWKPFKCTIIHNKLQKRHISGKQSTADHM